MQKQILAPNMNIIYLQSCPQQFSQLTRDGEVYHDYCLNYSKAVGYLDQLRKNEDFSQFEKVCNISKFIQPV